MSPVTSLRKVSRSSGIAVLTGLTGLSLLLSGCSAESTPGATSSAEATTGSTSEPSKTVSSDPTVAFGPVIETTKGKYRQVKLNPDDAAYDISKVVVPEDVKAVYSDEELKAGVRAGIDLMIKNIIDPPVIDNELPRDTWWETAKNDIDPYYQEEFRSKLGTMSTEGVGSGSPVIENPWWADKEYQGFSYVYDENDTRIKNLKIEVTQVWLVNEKDIAIETNTSYEIPASYDARAGEELPADGKRTTGVQITHGTMSVSVIKDDSQKWVLSGWQKNIKSPFTRD